MHERLITTPKGYRWKLQSSVMIFPSDYPENYYPFNKTHFKGFDDNLSRHNKSNVLIRHLDYGKEDVIVLKRELDALYKIYGIRSVEFQPVVVGTYDDGQPMMVSLARFVHGVTPDYNSRQLRKFNNTKILEDCQHVFEGLSRYYMDGWNEKRKILITDVSIFQMMYENTINGENGFVLVDIDPRYDYLTPERLCIVYKNLMQDIDSMEDAFHCSNILQKGASLSRSREHVELLKSLIYKPDV